MKRVRLSSRRVSFARRGAISWSVVAVVISANSLATGYHLFWPSSASDAAIEKRLIQISPIGTKRDAVEKSLVARKWTPGLVLDREGTKVIGLEADITPNWQKYRGFYMRYSIYATWYFDDDDKLDEIRIRRSVDSL